MTLCVCLCVTSTGCRYVSFVFERLLRTCNVHVLYMCCTCVEHVLGHANDSRHGHSRFTCNLHFCYVQCDLRFLERERERESE